MSIIAWIIVGCVAGLSASSIVVESRKGARVRAAILGVGGALVGGLLFRLLGSPAMPAIDVRSGMVWAVGALILLATSQAFGQRHRA